MSKEAVLWDDSALTMAFDQAMSNYKKMHYKGYEESSPGNAKAKAKEAIVEAPSSIDIGNDSSSQMLKAAEVSQDYVEVPYDTPLQDQNESDSITQDREEYRRLNKEYFELEEKRAKTWERLKELEFCGYRYPPGTTGPCSMAPGISSFQYQHKNQSCYPASNYTFGPNMYPCSATPCSLPPPIFGYSGPCTGSPLTSNGRTEDHDDIMKNCMLAAQNAITELTENAPGFQLEEKKGPSSNGETSLTDVLNAWYSAGLYTGKYLTEKSLGKR